MSASAWGESPDIGNTYADALEVAPNSTTNTLAIDPKEDLDYFKIVLTQTGQLTVKSTSASRDVRGTLYDSTGTNVIVTNTGDNNFIITRTLTPGTYYVKVEEPGNNQTVALYNFVSSFTLVDGVRPFTKREIGGQSSTNIRGNLLMIGNQLLCRNSVNGGACTQPTIGATNNSITQYFANVDTTTTTSGITSSSMARLDLQPDDTILWARLYWSARMINPDNTEKSNAQNIKFRTPASTTYQSITAENFDYFPEDDPYDYGASADVTALVQSGGAGQYYGANIQADTGTNKFASWMLLVVVQNNNRIFNNISIYDGFQVVFDGDSSYPNQVSTVASGFLTPRSGAVTSNLFVYSGESEAGIYDGATITNSAGVPTSLVDAYNTPSDLFNGTASNNGIHRSSFRLSDPGLANPNFENLIGTDIDKLTVTNLDNEQTQTTITIKSTGGSNSDRYSLNMFAFETKLYEPRFCYDYGYKQNGITFTEENNGTKMPYIKGYLPNKSEIDVSIYIRNLEDSDISASNVQLDITDINASEAIYTRNTVKVTYPNAFVPTPVSDAILNVGDTYIRDVSLGTMGGSQYAYAYYSLTPVMSGEIDMPLRATFSYDLSIPLPNGTTLTLPYSSTIGGESLQMCSGGNFSYTPQWGIFSMVDAGLYDTTDANKHYYDLTTQVVRRPGNFRIASFNPAALDTPQTVSTRVAVELIDASKFHDVDAACREPSSAVTPRVWTGFNNASQVNFNAATINQAIADGAVSDTINGLGTSLSSADDFYNTATPNAAYRVTFNVTNDGNESLIQTAPGTPVTNTQILNFTQLVQDIQHCAKPVEMPSNPSSTTTLVSVACGNAGNQGIDNHHMAICMECLYGYNTQVLCSRDNFAIRPESYTITLKDDTVDIAPNHTGVPVGSLNTDQVKMSAGYPYNYELAATNHRSNIPTNGYTRYFGTANNEYNVSLTWNSTKTGCNDTDSRAQTFNMIDGYVMDDANHSQVGEYILNMIDKTWTQVDWNSMYQAHQIGSHFVAGAECLNNSSYVPLDTTVVSLNGGSISNLVGCDIKSAHDNIQASLAYRDYNIAFRPNAFDLSSLRMSTGIDFNVSAMNTNTWTYMNNLTESANMGVRYSGAVRAVGFSNEILTNFVKDCYAEPINMNLNLTFPTTAGLPNWRYRLQELNASIPAIWRDSNAVIASPITNTSFNFLSIPESGFLKNQNGLIDMNLSINFDRNQTLPVDPISVGLGNLQVKCQTSDNCKSIANGSVNHLPDANLTTNSNVTFAYGRLLTKDIRVFGPIGFTANGWYEVFNLPTFNTTAYQPSKNGVRWFINAGHDDISHGDANVTRLMSLGTPSGTVNYGGDDALGAEAFGFPAITPTYNGKAHVDTAPWLWHAPNALIYSDPSAINPANAAGNDAACLTHPCFNVTVMPAIGATGSAKDTNEANKDSKRSTGGTGWRSTTDYSPAIR